MRLGKPGAVAALCAAIGVCAAAQTGGGAKPSSVLALRGPGGSVAIGDGLAAAKRAFPAPKGATQMEAMNFAILGRKGWSWMVEKPGQAFEVSLKNGKIAAIARTIDEKRPAARQKLIDADLARLPKPTNQAKGRTAAVYAWSAGHNARFLVTMDSPLMGAVVMIVVGDRDDLKLLNYRVDDVATLVKQLDIGADAMKKK